MQERVKTSFIPKASLSVEREQHHSTNPIALANILGVALLILAILGSAGMFLFERYTVQSIETKKKSLELSRAAFEPATIKELSRLNTRIEAGKKLLNQHVSLSHLFDDLETRTLSTLRFNDFSYDTGSPGRVILTMSGFAQSFNTVALQSENFSDSDIITEPIFSNVNIDRNGQIKFDFDAVVNISRIGYNPGAQTTQQGSDTEGAQTHPPPQQ
jgi:hypothetical protein